jgi:CHAD domain-containing protein
MSEYVRVETAVLLRRLAYQVSRAAKGGDAESIHDLRVAIRRLSRCLRVFAEFYPGKSWKKIRRRLHDLMQSAGAVRDLDIALEILHSARMNGSGELSARLEEHRRRANNELLREVRRWKTQGFSKDWRTRLDLLP